MFLLRRAAGGKATGLFADGGECFAVRARSTNAPAAPAGGHAEGTPARSAQRVAYVRSKDAGFARVRSAEQKLTPQEARSTSCGTKGAKQFLRNYFE